MEKLIWYFAYGSNMKESRLQRRIGPASEHLVGYVEGFSFRYNKIGADNTAKGNIIQQQRDKVWGVFFKISGEKYTHLHKAYELGYRQVELHGTSSLQQPIQAKSFTALPKNIDDTIEPSPDYQKIVVAGAREKGLPQQYIASLRT